MRTRRLVIIGISSLALLASCADDDGGSPGAPAERPNSPQATATPSPEPSPGPSASPSPVGGCSDLSGTRYVGKDGQGGTPGEGCEGCGNPGEINFTSGNQADLVMPGDDVIQSCTYAITGRQLRLTCDGSSKTFRLSPDCRRLSVDGFRFDRE